MEQLKPTIPTVAITGSAGKTTTKEMIASVLETKWQIFKSKKNRNQRHHTKKHAAMIGPEHQAVVLEFGMGRKNAGQTHCSYIQPNIGVITNVGYSHFGMLGNSIKSTAKAKSALIEFMNPDGALFINKDDNNSKLLNKKNFEGRIFTVGINSRADYRAINVEYTERGMQFQVKLDKKLEKLFVPTFGGHNVSNALFAVAVCHYLKFTPEEIRAGLESYQSPPGRLNINKLVGRMLLIDDTYNANPEATQAAIDVLVEMGKGRTKVVVLGDMLELGWFSANGHKKVGKYLAPYKVDFIITFGKKANWIKKGATGAGFPVSRIFSFTEREKMHTLLEELIRPEMTILVKGSHKMKMKTTVEYLLKQFS